MKMTLKRWIGAGSLVVAAAFLLWMWIGRSSSEADAPGNPSAGTEDVTAAVARVERRSIGDALTVAGEFKPFQDVDVHAKVAGYIKTIYVDVGTHVKEGQTLAVLEVPELAAQLAGADAAVRRATEEIGRAQGDLARARSTHSAAHSAYQRLSDASKTKEGLVAQQELDDAQAKDLEAEAQVSSAKSALSAAEQELEVSQANQKQFSALSDYTRITAPYAGVVTVRYSDTGALVAAGTSSSTQAMPVVRLAQISVLRLVLPIPESIAGTIRIGDPVKVHVQALNEDVVGKVTRFADSLDPQTRTMHTEIDFQNANGKLLPGMYVEATLSQIAKRDVLTVPLEAVEMTGTAEGSVLLLNPQNMLEERKVHFGQEGSTRIEVVSGLNEGDRIVVGSRSSFRSGMRVKPKNLDSGAPDSAGGK
jgi:RND family efflux transporter MFP subunit